MGSSQQRSPVSATTVQAVVLRIYPFRERDLIVRLLTMDGVKRGVLANAGRTKRFGAPFDVFDRGIFELGQGKGQLATVRLFTPAKSHPALRNNLDKFSAASVWVECIDHMILEDGPESPEIFVLLCEILEGICDAASSLNVYQMLHKGIELLMASSGYGLPPQPHPSAASLIHLLERIEQASERELLSKPSLISSLRLLKNQNQSGSDQS